MKILIIKLGAAGDVVRTTTLLNILRGEINWLTSAENIVLLNSVPKIQKCISWNEAGFLENMNYDLVINLEDSLDAARLVTSMKYRELFGAYLNKSNKIAYTESSKEWFDISLISNLGKEKADELKLKNRKTYQEMIFKGLGYAFNGERYFLPKPIEPDLAGDIAIAPKSGDVWPMKNWAYFDELAKKLDKDGYCVNYLPHRETLLEHIADVRNHKYLISGDSLPMHIALGNGIKCLSIFICTSPWEIYDYDLQKKIVSPNLEKYFYRRDFDQAAVESISIKQVYEAVISHIN